MRLKVIACEILFRELAAISANSVNRIDLEFMPKGLHDIGGEGMSNDLRRTLKTVSSQEYDAIVLGYGMCSYGVVGLAATEIPLVVPRAHDCITLFLGDRQRYLDYFNDHPGVYFKTTGWLERGSDLQQLGADAIQNTSRMNTSYDELVEKYGEENAQFLYREIGELTRNYGQITYIEMGVEPDDRFENAAREQAEERNWRFEKIQGDLSLLKRLLDGPWNDEDFLVVEPGCQIAQSYDDRIIKAVPTET
jgi:hypothetical protein